MASRWMSLVAAATMQLGCSLVAYAPPPGQPANIPPRCREIGGLPTVLDFGGSFLSGTVATATWVELHREGALFTRWRTGAGLGGLIYAIGITSTAAAVALVVAGVRGRQNSSRCARAREAHRNYFDSLSPQQQVEYELRERERKLAPLRARLLRKRRLSIRAVVGREGRMRTDSRGDELVLRPSHLDDCAALEWTAVVRKHRQALEEAELRTVSCIADGFVIWSGSVEALPTSIRDTACQPFIEEWSATVAGRSRAQLLQSIPKGCVDRLNAKSRSTR